MKESPDARPSTFATTLGDLDAHHDPASLRQRMSALTQHLQTSVEAERAAIEASQRIMHNLRPAILEQGLVAALQWMTQRFERRTGVEMVFRSSHESLKLPPGVPLVAYRTAQEALTNISKHAQATRVTVDLSASRGILSLEITDNGRGLRPEDLAKARSFGIRGLHERADTVGGWIELSSTPGHGTTMLLSVPIGRGSTSPGDLDDEDAPAVKHDPSSWGEL